MEDEELEEKVDTQATTDNANNAEGKSKNTNQESNQENGQENEEEKGQKADDEQDEKISNAFGNKSENKNEGGKSKKNTVAKTNEDGSITFKNQEELNGFIDRMFAKGAKKAEKSENKGTGTQEEIPETQEKQEEQQDNAKSQETAIPKENFTADIALALIEADINPKKARRVANLVDMSKVIVNGQLDEAKLKEEIDAIATDFPELKVSANESKEPQGFKFGAGQQENTDHNSNDVIASIFGNKK